MNPGDRSLFPNLGWRAYLNHASIGPLAAPTQARARDVLALQATQGVGAILEMLDAADDARAAFGKLIRSAKIDIGLTRNTSDGVTAVAMCHPYTRGQTVVLLRGEFPTNTTPWQRAAALHGLDIHWLDVDAFADSSGRGLDQLEQVLRKKHVAIVAVSAVQFQTGLRMPVVQMAELAHRHGAAIFVDAIQAAGAVPFSVKDADLDYLVAGGQKWLMGPIGTGLIYARRDRWRQLRPHLASWMSHTDPLVFLFEPGQLRYDRDFQGSPALLEGGSQNLAGHAALGTATWLAVELTPAAIFAHVQRYHDALEPGLQELGFTSRRATELARRSCILSLIPPEGHHAGPLASALAERGVSVSSPDGHLRFSPSWPNPLDEVDHVLSAVREVLTPKPAALRATRDQCLVPDLIRAAFGGEVPPAIAAVLPPPDTDFLGLLYKAAPILEFGGRGGTRVYVANMDEDEAFVTRILDAHPSEAAATFLRQLGPEVRKMVDTDGETVQLFLDDLHEVDQPWEAPEGFTLMCKGLWIPGEVRTWLSRHDAPPLEHLDDAWKAIVTSFTEAGFRGCWGIRWRERDVYSVLYVNEERWTGDPERSALLLDRLEDPRWRRLRDRARQSGWLLYPDSVELHADGRRDVTVGILDPAEVRRR